MTRKRIRQRPESQGARLLGAVTQRNWPLFTCLEHGVWSDKMLRRMTSTPTRCGLVTCVGSHEPGPPRNRTIEEVQMPSDISGDVGEWRMWPCSSRGDPRLGESAGASSALLSVRRLSRQGHIILPPLSPCVHHSGSLASSPSPRDEAQLMVEVIV